LQALELLLASPVPDTVVADVAWQVLKPLHESRRRRPLYERMGGEEPRRPTGPVGPAGDGPSVQLTKKLRSASGERQRADVLLDYVCAEVAGVLHLGGGTQISSTTGLFDLGMDSLMAVELRRRLEAGTGLQLPSTLTFNYPSAAALAGYLLEKIGRDDSASCGNVDVPAVGDTNLQVAPDAAGDLDDLSESELEERLLRQMGRVL
jgi:acyl carrier protein